VLSTGPNTAFGCSQPSIYNQSACDKIGGRWMVPEEPYTPCKPQIKGCNIPAVIDYVFMDDTDECRSCGGYNSVIFETIKVSSFS